MIITESIARLLPGVLGDEKDWSVPDVLLSGNHAKIEEWRKRHEKKA